MKDIDEQQRMLQESENEGVILTDFKDWLMDQSFQFVEGKHLNKIIKRKLYF